jgi:class 3 adenylate cyclase
MAHEERKLATVLFADLEGSTAMADDSPSGPWGWCGTTGRC